MNKKIFITSIKNLKSSEVISTYPDIIDDADDKWCGILESDALTIFYDEMHIEINAFNSSFMRERINKIQKIINIFCSDELYVFIVDGENWYHCVAKLTAGRTKIGGGELDKATLILKPNDKLITENRGFVEQFRKENSFLFK